MINRAVYWEHIQSMSAKNYKCGHVSCGREVSADRGWVHRPPSSAPDAYIYVCPNCKLPTLFYDKIQLPGMSLGSDVQHLPTEIEAIWAEIRTCTSHSAFTAAVLEGRKLLMHIAVAQGANPGLNFVQYVDHLVDNHFAPPNSKPWVEKIRTHGNEATHEIIIKTKEDAEEILIFLEMLLKFIYEFPARAP
jgi:hypothetical protein